MRERLRIVALGWVAACGGGQSGGPTPRAGEPCEVGSAARCGIAEGNDEAKDAVLACDDGTWTQLLHCGQNEHCFDDDARGAVVCTMVTEEIVYGEFDGPCDVASAQACSIDRDYAMKCDGGKWTIETDCSTDVLECALVDSEAEPTCTDAAGCVVCR